LLITHQALKKMISFTDDSQIIIDIFGAQFQLPKKGQSLHDFSLRYERTDDFRGGFLVEEDIDAMVYGLSFEIIIN
jgi:hypothetical protein